MLFLVYHAPCFTAECRNAIMKEHYQFTIIYIFMDTPMGKKYLYIVIIVALLAFSYGMVGLVGAVKDSIDPSFARSFSVSGEGKVIAVPDVAQFSFTVITEGGNDVSALQQKNTESANAAIDFIKSQGIAKEDITTQGYSVSPRYQYYNCSQSVPIGGVNSVEPCPPAEIVGYTVSQTVLVKARENKFGVVGELLSGVVEHGANSVSQLWFTIDDPAMVEQEAREKAIEQAKEKAKATARAGGFRLGRLLSLNEGGYTPFYKGIGLESIRDAGIGSTAAVPAPSIEPGSQDVMVTVTLLYEIR